MNIALMNEKVIFQKCSVVKDGIGNHRNEWTEDYCCFATIGGEGLASSREAETAGTVVEDVGMTVTCGTVKRLQVSGLLPTGSCFGIRCMTL